jgi:hypothetical protein
MRCDVPPAFEIRNQPATEHDPETGGDVYDHVGAKIPPTPDHADVTGHVVVVGPERIFASIQGGVEGADRGEAGAAAQPDGNQSPRSGCAIALISLAGR